MTRERQASPTNALRFLGVLVACAALAWSFRETDASRVTALLARIGMGAPLILVPQGVALLLESLGWQVAFIGLGARLPLLGLLRARLASEALAQTLPLGVVFCESIKPTLLARTCRADLATSLSGMAARKWLLLASQTVYVAAFGVLAFPALSSISSTLLRRAGLPYVVLGVAFALLLLTLGSLGVLSRGRIGARGYALLARVPWLRRKLTAQREKFDQTDGRLERLFASPRAALLPLPAFLAGWLFEAVETALILHLLGVKLNFATVGAIEVSSGFIRNVACLVPAGLGAQDMSYLAFLRAFHVPDALNVAATFLLLKRAKECFWAVIGYVLLAADLKPLTRLSEAAREGAPC